MAKLPVAGPRWFESDRERFLVEFDGVAAAYPNFAFGFRYNQLVCQGTIDPVVGVLPSSPLVVRLECPQSYPVRPPIAAAVAPTLPKEHRGHVWHVNADGSICYVKPSEWEVGNSLAEVIEKVEDWYFNYRAVNAGLIDKMPESGRANLE